MPGEGIGPTAQWVKFNGSYPDGWPVWFKIPADAHLLNTGVIKDYSEAGRMVADWVSKCDPHSFIQEVKREFKSAGGPVEDTKTGAGGNEQEQFIVKPPLGGVSEVHVLVAYGGLAKDWVYCSMGCTLNKH